jgi:AbiV family abortive infection protein
LLERGSYGHAISLLVLWEEEIGKAVLWICYILGFVSRPDYLTHRAKQFTGVTMSFVMEQVFPPIFEELRKIPHGLRDEEKLQKAKEIAENFKVEWSKTSHETLVAALPKEVQRFVVLEEKKQSGFYVDVREGNVLSSPSSVTKRDAIAHLELVKRRFERLSPLFPAKSQGSEVRIIMGAFQETLADLRDAIPKLTEALRLASGIRQRRR